MKNYNFLLFLLLCKFLHNLLNLMKRSDSILKMVLKQLNESIRTSSYIAENIYFNLIYKKIYLKNKF